MLQLRNFSGEIRSTFLAWKISCIAVNNTNKNILFYCFILPTCANEVYLHIDIDFHISLIC